MQQHLKLQKSKDPVNMTEICIEPYIDIHRLAVINLILEIQNNEFGVAVNIEQQPDLQRIPEFYQVNKGNFWVARVDETVVGTIGLLDIGNGLSALRKMFVNAAHRGSELGIGQKLLDTVLHWAISHQFDEILLGTTAKFIAAHRFYEKNGFVQVEKTSLPREFPVMTVDTRFYRRVIDI
jgi:N-acetylglutamate synthase-like GNAT family acetyltransferase